MKFIKRVKTYWDRKTEKWVNLRMSRRWKIDRIKDFFSKEKDRKKEIEKESEREIQLERERERKGERERESVMRDLYVCVWERWGERKKRNMRKD